MSEPSQRQIGDGPDEYGRAIGQMARAAKRAGAAAAVPALAAQTIVRPLSLLAACYDTRFAEYLHVVGKAGLL